MNTISIKYNWPIIQALYAVYTTKTGIVLYKDVNNSDLIDMRGSGRAQIIYDPTDDKVKISENGSSYVPIIQTIPPIPPFYNFLSGLNMNVLITGNNVTYSTITNPIFTNATIAGYDMSTIGGMTYTMFGEIDVLNSRVNQPVLDISTPTFAGLNLNGNIILPRGNISSFGISDIQFNNSQIGGAIRFSTNGVDNFASNNGVIYLKDISTYAGYNMTLKSNLSVDPGITIDGYDISTIGSSVSTLNSLVNQSVTNISSPTFNELTLSSSTPLKLFVAGSTNKVATVSALHWDPTNLRLGINTSTPSTTLDISSSVSSPNLRLFGSLNTDNRIFAYLTNSGTLDPLFRLVAARGLVSNASGDITAQLGLEYGGTISSALRFHRGGSSTDGFLSMSTNSLERLRIDNSGLIGINTISPTQTLDVNGIIRARSLPIIGGNSTDTDSTRILSLLKTMSSGNTCYLCYGESNSAGNQAEFGFIYNGAANSSNAIFIGLHSKKVLTCLYNGNCGIGQSSPSYPLDVLGQSRFTNGVIAEGTNGLISKNTTASSYSIVRLQTDTTNDLVLFKNGSTRSTDGSVNSATLRNDGGDMKIASANGGNLYLTTDGTDRIKIDKDGYISGPAGYINFSNPNTGSNNTTFTFQNGTSSSDGSIVLQPWSGGSAYLTMNYLSSGTGFIRGFINNTSNIPFITLTSSGGAKHDYFVLGTSNLNVTGAVRYNSGNLEYYNGSSWQTIIAGTSPTVSALTVTGNLTVNGSNRANYGDFNNLNSYTDSYMKVNNRFVGTQFASEGDAYNYFTTLGGRGFMQFMVGNGSPSGIGSSDYGWAFAQNNATGKRYYQLSSTSFFTGQHCVKSNDVTPQNIYDYIGRIVCATGTYIKPIEIDEALPNVELSSKYKQKNVFGIVCNINTWNNGNVDYIDALNNGWSSGLVDDECILVNSIGEGSIWVVSEILEDVFGVKTIVDPIENGDYITTSDVIGFGCLQKEPTLCNFTVAKITQDETFNDAEEFEYNGKIYRKSFVGCTYHCG